MTQIAARQPAFVSLVNRILKTLPVLQPELDSEIMKARARRATGLNDFGDDPAWAQFLDIVTGNLQSHQNLTPLGKYCAKVFYQFKLVNKLRVVDFLAKNPEILQRPVERPIFIVGWYRTGTTALHNLLASSPRHRAFRTWELITPYPLSRYKWLDRVRKKFRGHLSYTTARFLMPEYKYVHPLKLEWPEEDFFFLENDLIGPTLLFLYGCYDYARKICDLDVNHAYASMRQQVQILGNGDPRRLIFKAPIHFWNISSLYRQFPDAMFVFTHRNPLEALVSNCSMAAITNRSVARYQDMNEIGQFWLSYNKLGLQRSTHARQAIPDEQQIDVPLPALATNPIGTVKRIYDYFELSFDQKDLKALENSIDRRDGRPAEGLVHSYKAEDFGLDADRVNTEFADYLETYQEMTDHWKIEERS